jgi:hypothetical protein
LVDILETTPITRHDRVALVIPAGGDTTHVIALKKQLVDTGHTVRVVTEAKNMRVVYEQLVSDGFSRVVSALEGAQAVEDLTWKDLT